MEKQMEKNFWCKIEGRMRKFIQHADKKETFICCTCGYTTSKPIEEPPEIKTPEYYFTYV